MAQFHILLSDGRRLPGRADHTLLRQLQDAGIRVPVACSNGHCGRCFARSDDGVNLPLCTTRVSGDIALELPIFPQWQRYSCQLLERSRSELLLRLPAGRVRLDGDQWLVCGERNVSIARFLERRGRLLRLAAEDASHDTLLSIVNVESVRSGRYQLREGTHILLRNLTAGTARELQESLLHYRVSISH